MPYDLSELFEREYAHFLVQSPLAMLQSTSIVALKPVATREAGQASRVIDDALPRLSPFR